MGENGFRIDKYLSFHFRVYQFFLEKASQNDGGKEFFNQDAVRCNYGSLTIL